MYAKIFMDSGGFIALVDRNDIAHRQAMEFYRVLSPTTRRVTSLSVVGESFTWIKYNLGGDQAKEWLGYVEEATEKSLLEIIYPEQNVDLKARRLIYRFDDQPISYTDALTLAILQSRPDIDAVFAFDHHLALAGLPVLPGFVK